MTTTLWSSVRSLPPVAQLDVRLEVDDGGVHLETGALVLVPRVSDDVDGVLHDHLGALDAGAPYERLFGPKWPRSS